MEDIHNEGRRTRLAPYRVLAIIERLDRSVTNVFSPIGITTLGFFTLYYTALSYGFVVIGIMGGRAGLTRLVASSSSHPMLVIIGVPMIPVGLVLLEAAELEEKTLLLWRKKVSPFISQLPVFGSIINYLWPSLTREPFIGNQMGGVASTVDYLARSISGGLMLPFVGYAIGRTLFKSRTSNVERTLLGMLVWFIVKTSVKVILKHHQYRRQGFRRVLNYDPSLDPLPPSQYETC